MTKIILDVSNYHEIFRNKEINVGDTVENLRSWGSLDLIMRISEKDPKWGYVLFGYSQEEKGKIIERKYWAREKVNSEIVDEFSANSPQAIKYNKDIISN